MEIYTLQVLYFEQTKVFRKLAVPKLALIPKFVEFMAESFDLYRENIEDYFIGGRNEQNKRWKITSQEIINAVPFKRKEYNLENLVKKNPEFITVINQKTPYIFNITFLENAFIEKSTQPLILEKMGEIEIYQ